ncbi:hypothetical protein VPMS16_3116 [Vibrio sp. 16]|nr:hypothetical protein VPMS16_3116 [Vibrio sp. 16]
MKKQDPAQDYIVKACLLMTPKPKVDEQDESAPNIENSKEQ